MSAPGYTPIVTYNSSTTGHVPTTGSGTITTGELAVNITDGILFVGTGTNTYNTLVASKGTTSITTLGTVTTGTWNATAIGISYGGTGQTTASAGFNALSPITTTGDLIIGNGSNSATRLAIGANNYVLTSNGTTASWAAVPSGVSLSANNTWTGTQTFNGTSSIFGTVLLNAAETTTVSATAATGTINFYVNSQSVLYYTSNASANWTLNVAFSSGTSLNTAMSTGQTVTIAFLVTQGTTAYYENVFQIDGTNVTPKWQGGTAPSKGNASGIDVYTYTITKTASATYTVLASQTQFA
jgi:hypothetical protein